MNFFKKWFGRRKIQEQIEELKLKNEKMKLKAQIANVKTKKMSADMSAFVRTLEKAEEIKDFVGTKDNALLQLLESGAGKQIIGALIAKFGGGETGANAVLDLLKKLTPEQKAALVNEIMGGKK